MVYAFANQTKLIFIFATFCCAWIVKSLAQRSVNMTGKEILDFVQTFFLLCAAFSNVAIVLPERKVKQRKNLLKLQKLLLISKISYCEKHNRYQQKLLEKSFESLHYTCLEKP